MSNPVGVFTAAHYSRGVGLGYKTDDVCPTLVSTLHKVGDQSLLVHLRG